jgi:hypothetical protein
MKNALIPFLLLSSISAVFGQSAEDALRYSFLQPAGTARFMGAGGAFTALGTEFGGLSVNPAGIALFRSNEFVLTPSIRFNSTDAALPGTFALNDKRANFNLDNAGIVFYNKPRKGKWVTTNLGLGYNRVADFNQSLFYEGAAEGTLTTTYFNDANAVLASGGNVDDFDPFGSLLAWDANALYVDNNGFLSYDFIDNPDVRVNRLQQVTARGGINEMQLTFGGNYDERLMVGASVGFPIVRYQQDSEYTESDPGNLVPFFDGLRQTQFLSTEGVGVNLKLGFIYHVNQMIRLGASFHSPTWMNLTDAYSTAFSYSYTDGGGAVVGRPQNSPDGVFDYRLNTPWRANTGIAAVIAKNGFLSADVEWVDYSASRYNFTANAPNTAFAQLERERNAEIQRNYRTATNLRFGAEWAQDIFRLRGGLNLLGTPAANDTGFETAVTAGVGVRLQGMYADLGFRRFLSQGSLSAYSGAPVVALDNRTNTFLLTIGFKF